MKNYWYVKDTEPATVGTTHNLMTEFQMSSLISKTNLKICSKFQM